MELLREFLTASTQAIVRDGGSSGRSTSRARSLPIATVLFTFSQLLLALAVFVPALLWVSGGRLNWPAVLVVPVLLLRLLFHPRHRVHSGPEHGVLPGRRSPDRSGRNPALLADADHLSRDHGPAQLQGFFKLSPLAAFATMYQDVLFWGRLPEGLVASTGLGWTVAALLGGHALFRRFSGNLAEEV